MAALLIAALRNNPDMFEKINPLLETSLTVNLGILPWVVNRPVKMKTISEIVRTQKEEDPNWCASMKFILNIPRYGGRLHHSLRLDAPNKEVQFQRLKDLLHAGADTSALDNGSCSVIIKAMWVDRENPDYDLVLKRVETIVEANPSCIIINNDTTAIHNALRVYGDNDIGMGVTLDVMKILLKAAPNAIHIKDRYNQTPLERVMKSADKWPELVELFEEHAAAQ